MLSEGQCLIPHCWAMCSIHRVAGTGSMALSTVPLRLSPSWNGGAEALPDYWQQHSIGNGGATVGVNAPLGVVAALWVRSALVGCHR